MPSNHCKSEEIHHQLPWDESWAFFNVTKVFISILIKIVENLRTYPVVGLLINGSMNGVLQEMSVWPAALRVSRSKST